MKIKSGFILRNMGGQPVVVSVGAASKVFNGLVKLNATGELLWNKLLEDATEEELTDALVEKYEVTREQAAEDVKVFIDTLSKPGIIE